MEQRVKILVVIRGGVLQEIRVADRFSLDMLEVDVLDWDNVQAGDKWHGMRDSSKVLRYATKHYPKFMC
jgi:hypothetical protein